MENILTYEAKIINNNIILVTCNKHYSNKPLVLRLYDDGKFLTFLTLLHNSEINSNFLNFEYSLNLKLELGHEYYLLDERNELIYLDLSYFALCPEFEAKYRYDGELGPLYSKEETTFRVFSPLASFISLCVFKDNDIRFCYLKRLSCGVYEGTIKGDLEGYKYMYLVKINGKILQVNDPYAKSFDTNSRYAYIIDVNKVKNIPDCKECLTKLDEFQKIIYEINVRDMSFEIDNNIKGAFNKLSIPNLKDGNNNPVGLNYIASLNVSHVQIMPVYDFQTTADDFPSETYNWGYDPKYYFNIEGSFSSDPENCYTRLYEFKKMVTAFHKKNLRVIMDVVYNHTFLQHSNALNILCPNYYYRHNLDGSLSNGSGCGNEIESRNYMARKLIIDNVKYFMDIFGIDGFRFDLMGLIDQKTINEVYKEVVKREKDGLVYGEGWDMLTTLPLAERTSLTNATELPNIGFFNDRFRDVVRGKNAGGVLAFKGYLTGDINYIDGFKHVFLGSIVTHAFPPLFKEFSQSINYVECHDDGTLFDKLIVLANNDMEEALARLKLINFVTIISFGIPFIHAGQEIGLSKQGLSNTYNAGDEINSFKYSMLEKRKEELKFFKDSILFKKRYLKFENCNKKDLVKNIKFENLSNGAILITILHEGEDKIGIFINPTKTKIIYQLDSSYREVFNNKGLVNNKNKFVKQVDLEGLSVFVIEV